MFRRRRAAQFEPGFKDYYLILQVHPEADGAMIDAAYWHLARRYGEARLTDDSARAMMDDLNEAYSVLRNSERRADFNRIRTVLLGSNALPEAPPPPSEPVPLAVMERQRPRAREQAATEPRPRRGRSWPTLHLVIPGWQRYLSALVLFALAVVALVWAHPAVVVALFTVGVVVTLIPLVRSGSQLTSRPAAPASTGSGEKGRRSVPHASPGGHADSAASLRDSVQGARERLRQTPSAAPPQPTDDPIAVQGKS